MFFLIIACPRAPQPILRVQVIPEEAVSSREAYLVTVGPETTCGHVVDSLQPRLESDFIFFLTHVDETGEHVTAPNELVFQLISGSTAPPQFAFRLRCCRQERKTPQSENLERASRIQDTKPTASPSRSSRPPSSMAVTKGSSDGTSDAKSPERPPSVRSPERPPSVLKSPERPPSVLKSPERPPSVLKSPERPPSVLKSPERPPSVLKSPERPPSSLRGSGRRRTEKRQSSADSGALTVEELRQISARQQRHIELQRQKLSERTSRLQQLRRRDAARKKTASPETEERTTELRSRIEECELTIRQAMSSRTQVNEFRFSNENMALELDSLKTTFAEKQRELSRYSQRVEELKMALERLRGAAKTPPPFEKPPGKEAGTEGLLKAMNAELKIGLSEAKFGIAESDDAKELSRRMDEKRGEGQRLDEQITALRRRLGRPEPPPPLANPSPPRPARQSHSPSPQPPHSLPQPKPPRPPPPPRSTSPLRPPRLHALVLGGGRGAVTSSLEQLPGGPRPSRYAPRSVIADTYMRRLRPGRAASLTALPGPRPDTPATLRLELPPKPPNAPAGTDTSVTTSTGAVTSVVTSTAMGAVTSTAMGAVMGVESNNDSGRGPSLTSSGLEESAEDDVFANGAAVPPPAAFEGEISSSSANTTPTTTTTTTHDYSSDSLSTSSGDQGPRRPPDASVRPTKSCLKSPDSGAEVGGWPSIGRSRTEEGAGLLARAKTFGSGRNGMKQSVSFDPLALMLDAAMEGELSLVRTTASQVTDVSASNDEGTTALHNSVCCGHDDVSRFLVEEAAADVNASDIDGWTPLHCAASCGNLPMARLLVERGAAVFLRTSTDLETALEKCEEESEGGQRTAEYLFSIQEELGISDNGLVYAAFRYEAKNPDELSFAVSEPLTILKKGDAAEEEWFWARNAQGNAGYVPSNFLAIQPRLVRSKRSLSSPVSPATSKPSFLLSSTALAPSVSSGGSADERSDKTAF